MQMQLPIFPANTQMLSNTWGVFEKDNFVYYLHNGSPVHIHSKSDLNTYRYVTASLVVNHSCSPSELSKVFGVGSHNFERYARKLRKGGAEAFFSPDDRRGKCYQMTDEKIKEAQRLLDTGLSNVKTANKLGVKESTIRYHIKKGTLKKKHLPKKKS